jgi:hypothetical protein
MKLKNINSPACERTVRELCRRKMTGSMVLGLLSEETTEEAIVEKLRALYDVPGDVVEADVRLILSELRTCGALEE